MAAAAVHDVVVAVILGRFVMVVRVPVSMALGGRDDIRDPRVLVVLRLAFDRGLDSGRANEKERRDQRLNPPRHHDHGSIA